MPKSRMKSIVNNKMNMSLPSSMPPKSSPTALHSATKAPNPVDRVGKVAVHFGNFYGNKKKDSTNVEQSSTLSSHRATKSDFTQRMVRKLEKLTGTVDYSRQLAAFLNESVEPPNFSIESPPADNCAPGDDLDASYPLWYKDPDKMSCFASITEENFLKDKFNINQDNYNDSTTHPIPCDEWDLSISQLDADKINQNRKFYCANLKKKFQELNNTSCNSKVDFKDCNSPTDDSALSDNEITIE